MITDRQTNTHTHTHTRSSQYSASLLGADYYLCGGGVARCGSGRRAEVVEAEVSGAGQGASLERRALHLHDGRAGALRAPAQRHDDADDDDDDDERTRTAEQHRHERVTAPAASASAERHHRRRRPLRNSRRPPDTPGRVK